VTGPNRPAARDGPPRIFLLSPALLAGVRGRRILDGSGPPWLVEALAGGGRVPLGDVHAFISALYFRGKRAYARRFGLRAGGSPALVITPDRGLVPDDEPVDRAALARMAEVAVDPAEPRYRTPLVECAGQLVDELGPAGRVVLLGSLATPKYLEPLGAVLSRHLLVPAAFIGRGDMQRGSLLLRAVEAGEELAYVRVPASPAGVGGGPRSPGLEG
jgi:hypothetical protein